MMHVLRGDPLPYLPAPRAWFRRLCGAVLFSFAAAVCLLALIGLLGGAAICVALG